MQLADTEKRAKLSRRSFHMSSLSFFFPSFLSEQFAVKRPVVDRFRDVVQLNPFAIFQVGSRAAYFQDPVVAASRRQNCAIEALSSSFVPESTWQCSRNCFAFICELQVRPSSFIRCTPFASTIQTRLRTVATAAFLLSPNFKLEDFRSSVDARLLACDKR